MFCQKLVKFVLIFAIIWHTAQPSTEYNRYLAHLFQKYGNGGTMTFEGLEHLMASLGLGQIEFEPAHTIEEHRPKGFKLSASTENNTIVKSYFEQQTKKLLDNAVDVELSNVVDGNKTQQQEEAQMRTQTMQDNGVVLEFRELHDPKHRHPRENAVNPADTPLPSGVCLSPKSLLSLIVDHNDLHKHKLYKSVVDEQAHDHNSEEEYNEFINSVRITPLAFMKLCPALLAQIDNHVCVRPAPLIMDIADNKELLWQAWIYASSSIFILSACGLLGVLLVPLMKSAAYQEILKFLVAVAVGTLSGDALMHLLPHALMQESHDAKKSQTNNNEGENEHEHDNKAVFLFACAFATAVFMYILENLIPLLRRPDDGGHNHGHGHGHSHGHSHTHEAPPALPAAPLPAPATAPATTTTAKQKKATEINVMLDETVEDKKTPNRPLTPVAFMVIIGDGLHNLTDGLAIGAAFGSDPVTGMATAFAVLCHELPHELGDFALLLQTGVSIRRAVCLNIVSSVLSFMGMAIGLLIASEHANLTPWIYSATAGSFLYIAFADLVPTMSVVHTPQMARDLKSLLVQIFGIIVGGLIMLLIAMKEHDLEKLFKRL